MKEKIKEVAKDIVRIFVYGFVIALGCGLATYCMSPFMPW